MKSDFFYNPRYNQMQHIKYPILIDVEDHEEMSEDEIINLITQRIKEINLELNEKIPKKEKDNLTSDEIKTEFEKLKRQLGISETFKSFFYQTQKHPLDR